MAAFYALCIRKPDTDDEERDETELQHNEVTFLFSKGHIPKKLISSLESDQESIPGVSSPMTNLGDLLHTSKNIQIYNMWQQGEQGTWES